MALFTSFEGGFIASDGGISVQLQYGLVAQEHGQVNFTSSGRGSASSNHILWKGSYPQSKIMHVVVTSDGLNNGAPAGQNVYLNGRKYRVDQSTIGGATSGIQKPIDDMYRHGRWEWPFGDLNKQPEKTERIQVFDKELSNEDVQELYYNINSARGGAPTVSNLFRDYDFSAIAAGMIPELVAGFDMTIVTGGAQPTNPSFY